MLGRMSPAIDACELVVRLQTFALGDDQDVMSDAQVTAALGLLDRVMPTLIQVQLNRAKSAATATRVVRE